MKNFQKYYAFIIAALWVVALLGLPLTSFPLYAELTNAIVAPFSVLPILLLLILWLLPFILHRNQLPIESKLIFVFLLWAVIASAQAFFLQIPTFKEATPLRQEVRAFLDSGDWRVVLSGFFYLFHKRGFHSENPAVDQRWRMFPRPDFPAAGLLHPDQSCSIS